MVLHRGSIKRNTIAVSLGLLLELPSTTKVAMFQYQSNITRHVIVRRQHARKSLGAMTSQLVTKPLAQNGGITQEAKRDVLPP